MEELKDVKEGGGRNREEEEMREDARVSRVERRMDSNQQANNRRQVEKIRFRP